MKTLNRIGLLALAVHVSVVTVARAESEPHQQFFASVASGEVQQLSALMDPTLTQEIDEPILQTWMQALNGRLGKLTGISESSRTSKQTFTGKIIETTAAIQFEKGTATSELTTLNGKLVAFNVQSDQLGSDWFQGPAETKLYQKLGAKLIRKIMTAEADEAYDLMHEAVHAAMNREQFQQLVEQIAENGGELQAVAFSSSEMQITDDSQMLVMNYDVTCKRASGTCEVKVQFIGLKGHLMGFNFR